MRVPGQSPTFQIGSPGREDDNLRQEAAIAPQPVLNATSAFPGSVYAIWQCYVVVNVQYLIYKPAEGPAEGAEGFILSLPKGSS